MGDGQDEPELDAETDEQAPAKIVDFGIALEVSKPIAAARVEGEAPDFTTVNQTMLFDIRVRPLAISFETQVGNTWDRKHDQLTKWVAAWFRRVRLLGVTERPAMPVVRIHGPNWYIAFASELNVKPRGAQGAQGSEENAGTGEGSKAASEPEPRVAIGQELLVGDVRTLRGAYQVLAALRVLADWADTDFRNWIITNGLG